MEIMVSEIVWDTEGRDADELGLPTELTVDTVMAGIGDEDQLADWLSDTYGWCVMSYMTDQSVSPVQTI